MSILVSDSTSLIPVTKRSIPLNGIYTLCILMANYYIYVLIYFIFIIRLLWHFVGADSGTQVGCFADNPHDRDLTYEPSTDPSVGMWPPMCVHHCFNKGYYYAGLQAQFKCFCGNSYGRYGPASDCNLSCFPLTRYQCGGRQSNMIYTTGLSNYLLKIIEHILLIVWDMFSFVRHLLISIAGPANSVCLPGWKDYNNHCYLMILNKYSWSMARSKCQSMGADLVTVNSQAEQDMITSIISSSQFITTIQPLVIHCSRIGVLCLEWGKKITLQCTLTKQSELYYAERNVLNNNSISYHDSSTCTNCLKRRGIFLALWSAKF